MTDRTESTPDQPAPTVLPETMTALVQTAYGDPSDVLEVATIGVPPIGPGEVLVEVRATTVNTPDWIVVTGVPYILRLVFGLRGPKTPVRGTDVAGVVVALGDDVTGFALGDEVFGSSWTKKKRTQAGTFAELTKVPAAQLAHKPESTTFEQAAAAVMSGITALIALCDEAQVGKGTRVLINGASGGVGTFAVQIAKANGAHVTGVCSQVNTDLVLALGADEVIDYNEHDFTQQDQRYDVILDNVMNHAPSAMAKVLTEDGVFMPNSVGSGSRLLAGLPRMIRAMLLPLRRVNVKSADYKVDQRLLTEMAGLLRSGAVAPTIDSVRPLADGAGAVTRMLSHRAQGNIVILC